MVSSSAEPVQWASVLMEAECAQLPSGGVGGLGMPREECRARIESWRVGGDFKGPLRIGGAGCRRKGLQGRMRDEVVERRTQVVAEFAGLEEVFKPRDGNGLEHGRVG